MIISTFVFEAHISSSLILQIADQETKPDPDFLLTILPEKLLRLPVCPESSKMNLLVLLVLLFRSGEAMSVIEASSNASFVHIGNVASGYSMAHIVTDLDIASVLRQHSKFLKVLRQIPTSANVTGCQTRLEEISERAIENLGPSEQVVRTLRASLPHLHLRHKRQLGLLVGGVALGLSIYNRHELNVLKDKVSQMESETDALIHVVREQDHAIALNSKNIARLTVAVSDIAQTVWLHQSEIFFAKLSMEVESSVANHNAQVVQWANSLLSLIEGRVTLSLFEPDALLQAIERVKEKAHSKGLKLVETVPANVLRGDVSHVPNKKGLTLFIHVPLMKSQLKLYRFHHPAKQDSQMHIRSPKELLAVDQHLDHGRELDAIELHHCKVTREQLYLCPNFHVVRKGIKETCLGSIFLGYQAGITKACQFQAPEPANDALQGEVHQLSARSALFYLAAPTTAIIDCNTGGTPRRQSLRPGRHLARLDAGCKMTTSSWIFSPPDDFTLDAQGLMAKPSVQTINLNVTIPRALDVAAAAINDMESPSPRSFKALERLRHRRKWQQTTTYATWIAVLLLMLLAVVLIPLSILILKKKFASLHKKMTKEKPKTVRERIQS